MRFYGVNHLAKLGAVYLALSIPPILYPCAHILQDWIPTSLLPVGVFRRFVIVSIIMGVSLAISLAFPGESAIITVVTGCTGVLLTCYLVPIANHLLLYTNRCRPFHPTKPKPFPARPLEYGSS